LTVQVPTYDDLDGHQDEKTVVDLGLTASSRPR
jgi:hypothetical protein